MEPNDQKSPTTPEQPTEIVQSSSQPTDTAAPEQKSFLVALLLSILVGTLGVDRFYLGYIGTGILKLVTFGGCGIWYVVDIILIATDNLKDSNGQPLKKD